MQIKWLIYSLVIYLSSSFTLMAQDKTRLEFAKQTFSKTCILCHQPPDLNFATDRAWLNQVRQTT